MNIVVFCAIILLVTVSIQRVSLTEISINVYLKVFNFEIVPDGLLKIAIQLQEIVLSL